MRGTAILSVLLALAVNARAGYLEGRHLRLIREYWPDYVYAAQCTGVPVDILPAIHLRESELKRTRNIGGPFMLDLGGEGAEFNRRIRVYERAVWKKYGGHGPAPKVGRDFGFACLVAAHELKTKDRGRGLADMVWGYNGRAAWHRDPDGNRSHQASSYVWNDPKAGLVMTKRFKNKGAWVQYLDTRPGVMVIYAEIRAWRRGQR